MLVCRQGTNFFGVVINLAVDVADKNTKAIFLADSSCRVSLLGRSCFFALNPPINRSIDISNKVVTFLFCAAFNIMKTRKEFV
jgi:hypothetical protein